MANAQQRLGFATEYDAVAGFDKYIEGVSDVIFHTKNIQRLRALANQMRYRASDEGIKKQADAISQNPTLDDAQKQELLSKLFETGKFTLSNFVVELDEYTNLLANKKSRADRNMEQFLGRKMYNDMAAATRAVGGAMTAINLGSWLTNFIPLTQAWGRLDTKYWLRGMQESYKKYYKDDGFRDSSTFLTNRQGSDTLVKGDFEAATDVLSQPMEWIDMFVAESIVRGRYWQNLSRGMSEQAAMDDADAFAASIMADRSKGLRYVV